MFRSGFELVEDKFRKTEGQPELPVAMTAHSAGYDFFATKDLTLYAGRAYTMYTDVKVKLYPDQVLKLKPRSSTGSAGLVLLADVIDADYWMDEKTGGNIRIIMSLREGHLPLTIKKGQRIVQGIVSTYIRLDNDRRVGSIRQGGLGHTGKFRDEEE